MHEHMHVDICMVLVWRSEDNLGFGPQILFTFLLETQFLTDLEPYHVVWANWFMNSQGSLSLSPISPLLEFFCVPHLVFFFFFFK